MQVVRHGGKEVDQTEGAEHVLAPPFPRATLLWAKLGAQRPHPQAVFQGEKHHTPELELMEEIPVHRMDLGHRVQDHCRTIDQHHCRNEPLHVATHFVFGRSVEDLHQSTFQIIHHFAKRTKLPKEKAAPSAALDCLSKSMLIHYSFETDFK